MVQQQLPPTRIVQPKVSRQIQTDNLQVADQQRPLYVNYYYAQPAPRANYMPESSEPSLLPQKYSTANSQTMEKQATHTHTYQMGQAQQADGTVIVQPWNTYQGMPTPNLNEPPPSKPTQPKIVDEPQKTKKEVQETTFHDNIMVDAIKEITKSIQAQLTASAAEATENRKQSKELIEELIKAQNRRDLDPALLAIPTFTGKDPSQCSDWIQRIRNVCKQSGRALRQELINKSDLTVQTFIRALDEDMPEETVVDRILEYFSDIKTSTQAMSKLKTMYQAKDESILLFNQRFKAVLERIDATSVDNIRSDLQINMYLESIKPSISKGIKGNRFYGNKYAPTTLGEAMKKAEEAYLKDIYVWGEKDNDEEETGGPEKEVTIENIENRNRWTRDNTYRNESYRNNGDNQKRRQGPWNQRESSEPSLPSHLPRGTFTQITLNPMQLDDKAFTAWLEKLVEAKKNRHNNVRRPYRNFRKPYNDNTSSEATTKPQLKQYIKPAHELNVEEIQKNYQCTYEDIEEAVDLYNLDVQECRTA